MSNTVMYEKADVKYLTNIKGWVDTDGRYWGEDEHMARYCSCTHVTCKTEGCEEVVSKHRNFCALCEDKREVDKWEKAQKRVTSIDDEMYYSQSQDRYFQDWEEVEDFCEENSVNVKDLLLYHCEREGAPILDVEMLYEDITPEGFDSGDMINGEIEGLIEKLNDAMQSHPVNCFKPSKIAVLVGGGE